MAKNSPAADGIAAQVRQLRSRLERVEAKVPRPEAARSAYERAAQGVIARQVLDTNTSTWATDSATDMGLADVPVVAGRIYGVHTHVSVAWASVATDARWVLRLQVDSVDELILADLQPGFTTPGARVPVDTTVFWEPEETGTFDLAVRADEITDGANISFAASSANLRTFTLIDLGLAPS